jgi:hypothetical protein
MPVILKAVALGPTRGKRQHRIKPVKSLDDALFVHSEDRAVLRWVEIQSDHVGCFLFKLRVVAGHVTS